VSEGPKLLLHHDFSSKVTIRPRTLSALPILLRNNITVEGAWCRNSNNFKPSLTPLRDILNNWNIWRGKFSSSAADEMKENPALCSQLDLI